MAENTDISTPLVLAIPTTLKSLIEALVFASSEPIPALQLQAMIEETSSVADHRTVELAEIERAVESLNTEYANADRPYRIIAVAGGYQHATLPEYAGWISRLQRERLRRKLSQSALETLAIIAYKQPISKPDIEQIRGVNCDYVLKALLEKELVTITARAETVGRPLLYGTTREFLKHFGLNSVTDLPRPREIEEILGESQFETERRMLEAQAAAEAKKAELEDFPSRLPHIPKRKPLIPDEVEIVPRKRVRQIKTRPAPEEKTEPFSFVEGEPLLHVTVEPEQEVPIETVHAARPEPEVPVRESAPATRPEPEAPEEPVRFVVPEPEVAPTTAERTAKPPLAARSAERTAEEPAAPTLWRSWKEKIQSFIRKLFG
jgi:segregation and condensation protein B